MADEACENTDRELWRGPDEGGGSFYADSIHVTQGGGIGINCGGMVYVKPLRDWHALAIGAADSVKREIAYDQILTLARELGAVTQQLLDSETAYRSLQRKAAKDRRRAANIACAPDRKFSGGTCSGGE